MSLALQKPQVVTYNPILLDSLRVDSVLNFDLFVKLNRQMVLFRSADLPFNDQTRQKLIESGLKKLYVNATSRGEYQKYMEGNLGQVLSSPEISEESKAEILYEASAALIQDVLAEPTRGENIKRSKKVVEHTISYLLNGRTAFHNLMRITSSNYAIFTHSVNVCTYSLALARQAGMTDDVFLYELGCGSLLHDVGKSKISERILNKRGELSPKEFEIVKQHPRIGVDLLKETDEIPEDSYRPVKEHHERGQRRGYHDKLELHEMHIYSRIVAIADAFDAMTTERVYQPAMPSYTALKTMRNEREAYDPDLLRHFIHLMGPDTR